MPTLTNSELRTIEDLLSLSKLVSEAYRKAGTKQHPDIDPASLFHSQSQLVTLAETSSTSVHTLAAAIKLLEIQMAAERALLNAKIEKTAANSRFALAARIASATSLAASFLILLLTCNA